MATKHWGVDANYPNDGISTYGGNQHFANLMLYHMLRVANFDRLWECDGEVGPLANNPNHCEDGNMELADTTKWPAIAATTPTITKDTATVRSGSRSLKIVTDAAGEGVQSANLLSISNPYTRSFPSGVGDYVEGAAPDGSQAGRANYGFGYPQEQKDLTNCRVVSYGWSDPNNNGTFLVRDAYYNAANVGRFCKIQNPLGVYEAITGPTAYWRFERRYEVEVWARNTSGVAWDVVIDAGDGSPTTVGQIPVDAGGWVLYHFSFWAVSTGSRFIRFVDPVGGNTIYIDGVNVFRSAYEYAPMNVYGSDGKLTNPNQFSTNGSYTPGVRDVGMYLFIWDDLNNKNTGWYKIVADLGGGVVQLEIRSGTKTLTTNLTGNLRWRIVDVEAQAFNDLCGNFQRGMGYGVQSPHSSGWRFFSRLSADSLYKDAICWCAPNDEASFDWSTGQFYQDGPSSQRGMDLAYTTGSLTSRHSWHGPYGITTTRDWFMTDSDRSFFTFIHGTATLNHQACFVVGYTGADVDHPGVEEFVCLMRWEGSGSYDDIGWGDTGHFTYYGVTFDSDEIAVPCYSPVLGYGASKAYVLGQSNSGPNPWSGKEWLHPMIIGRDPTAQYGCPSERDSDIGIYCCRANLATMATFDSNNYLHFTSMLAWEWDGNSIL